MDNRKRKDIDQALTDGVARVFAGYRVTGMSAGLVSRDGLAWSGGFGYVDLESERAPDRDTVYRVGSITKTFTATAIYQLRDAGRLSIDDPVLRFIPEFAEVDARVGSVEEVTLRRLLCHHSGLVGEAPGDYWETLEFPSIEEFIARLPRTRLVIEADSAFKYSNLAFALLGEVVSRASETSYADYVAERILGPLGMSSSGFSLNDSMRSRMATGYQPRPHEDYPDIAPHPDLGGHAPTGQLYSTVSDLAIWTGFQLGSECDDEVLVRNSVEEMQRPQFLEPGWQVGYCLPWSARRTGDHVFLGHGGGIHGFLSRMEFDKERLLGAIVLTNSDGHMATQPVADSIFKTASSLLESDQRPKPSRPGPAPEEWRDFLGTYWYSLGMQVTIEFRNGGLVHIVPGVDPIVLQTTEEPDVFIVTRDRFSGEEMVFRRNSNGVVVGLATAGFPARKMVQA